MGKARDLARVIVDSSGLIAAGNLGNAVPADGSITNAKIASVAASKLTGQVPDANAPSGSIITSSSYSFTSRATFSHNGVYTTYVSGNFTKSRSDSQLLIILQLSVRTDANGSTASRFNIGSSTVFGGSQYTTQPHSDIVIQIFDVTGNTQTGSLAWSYQQDYNTFVVLNPTSADDSRLANSTSRVMIFEVMP